MSDSIIEAAYAYLRGHTTGDLRFDEHLRPIKYVVAADGLLVAPAMVSMLTTPDTVLFVPEYCEHPMELQVTLQEIGEREPAAGALTDRWRIHHGDPPDVRWASIHVDAARFRELVIDGDSLIRPNPLSRDEPRICRAMNERPDDLRRLCRFRAEVVVETPVMVAIDPLGLDIRGQFDVIRVPASEPMTTADEALARIEEMCRDAQAVEELRD